MSNFINPTKVDIIEQDLEDLKKTESPVPEPTEPVVPPPVTIVNKKTTIHFWAEDPNVLLQPEHALEFFPTEGMTFNQKLNAITRIVLILTAISYLATKKMNIIIVSVVSIVCIYLMFYYHTEGEGFKAKNGNLVKLYDRQGPKVEIVPNVEQTFQVAEPSNPLSNVLISDYDYNPNRKPAEPSYTKQGKENILEETKRSIQMLNPDQPEIDKKLFQDVTDNLELEQSMRQFYSTANTTIPNDQTSFAEFCYGDMISAKEGNVFASVRNNPRHNLY
tara:strand:+ start:62827 stop:63654 length:828 start_codon:yes stop_codon:yes gene_type:complete